METSRRIKVPYEVSDALKLLKYVRKYELYQYIKGNTIWKTAASIKLLPRKWQSMREHFTKTVYPSILRGESVYNPTPQDVQKFVILRDALQRKGGALHVVPNRIIKQIKRAAG